MKTDSLTGRSGKNSRCLLFNQLQFLVPVFILLGTNVISLNAQEPLFKLLPSEKTGIAFRNDINENENLNILAYEYFYNGGGVAVGDINNDGWEDVFFTANMKPSRLYLNQGNLKFKDITRQAADGLEGRAGGWKTGVTMADVNGDGLLDIYICYSGKVNEPLRRNQLFINQGNLSFVEKAKEFGLDDPGYSTQAAFFDYDNDGDLDMFLLNHNVKKYDNLELARFRNDVDELAGNKLFQNDRNHFTEVSKKAGIHQYPLTFGLGIAVADVNQDGWQDVYVTNDYNEPDYLYINNKDGRFVEESENRFRHVSQFSMGVDIADFNNDALPDIVTLDMLPEDNKRQKLLQLQENYESFQLMVNQGLQKQYMRNMLQLNNGDGTFSEIGQFAGVSNTDWSWCPLFGDFDNDGYKDLFITTGYLRDYTNKDFLRYWGDYKIKKALDREPMLLMDLVKAMPVTPFQNYIFRNNHDLSFSNKQKEWGFSQNKLSSGAVYADLDNDGDLDLLINNINENAFLYQNLSRENNKTSFLSIQLQPKANSTASGSKVYLYTKEKPQYQELNANRGYLSCVSTIVHFGLGDKGSADSVKIIWPDGKQQVLVNVKANQKLVIAYQPSGTQAPEKTAALSQLFSPVTPLVSYQRLEHDQNDFKRQLLMLFMYSKTGPLVAKADVNKDGLEDIFIAGDREKPSYIFTQEGGGNFSLTDSVHNIDGVPSTIGALAFFDANRDGFDDLYLGKGGYSLIEPNTLALQDELYLNNGKGSFVLSRGALPNVSASAKSCVRPCDYDNDGDQDIFVGGRIVPGKYPVAPDSYLLKNNGKGMYLQVPVPFTEIGLVTDAQWCDLNKDGRKDLVICGEFMPVSIFENSASGFVNKTSDYFSTPEHGFWFSIAIKDVNGDGLEDIIAGNLGMNSQIRASEKEPAEMYYADFDDNGSIDPFFNFYNQGISYPYISRDELNEQIYPMRKKFTSYKDYANATMPQIFTKEELERAKKLKVTETRTTCFINRNGKFVKAILPSAAQFSAVTNILAEDMNGDGHVDLLLTGNRSDNRLKLGSMDANYGCLLTGNGKGEFEYLAQPSSGICLMGDLKSALTITVKGNKYLVAGICDQPLQWYKLANKQ